MLEMRRLEVLAAAIREGSLAAAARSLGLTPGAASQAVSALEAQTGTTLLDRLPRGIRPTPAGERLAAHAEAALSTLRRAEAELAGHHGQTVRVAAFPTAVIGLLPATLTRLRAGAPDLDVQIIELEPDLARTALRAGHCDMALVCHHALLTPDANGPWDVVHVRDEPVWVALPLDHPLAVESTVSIGQLDTDPWITQTPASPCQELVHRACATAGFAPEVRATCSDYRSILALIGAGAGVSLIPDLALTGLHPPPVALRPTHPPIQRRINVLLGGRNAVSGAARAVVDALVEPVAVSRPQATDPGCSSKHHPDRHPARSDRTVTSSYAGPGCAATALTQIHSVL
jgi:DNA-binding transcriptional LysR family regulator